MTRVIEFTTSSVSPASAFPLSFLHDQYPIAESMPPFAVLMSVSLAMMSTPEPGSFASISVGVQLARLRDQGRDQA
jgi:hypothetical protein